MRIVATLLVLPACELAFPLEDSVGACELGTPFPPGVPVPIAGIHSVEGARFNPAQEVAMLALCPTEGSPQAIKDGCDLFQAPFIKTQQAFGLLAELGISADGAYDAYPTVTPNLSHILFASERNGGPQLFAAQADNGSFAMATATVLDVGLPFANEPYLVGDGSQLYYSASPSAVNWDLHHATGAPGNYQDFASLPGVNTPEQEFAPVVDDTELELFFASNRDDPGDNAALDIYTTSRVSTSAQFEDPRRVTELSTDGIDWPLWLSPDGCSLYYINKPYLDGAPQIGKLFVSQRSR